MCQSYDLALPQNAEEPPFEACFNPTDDVGSARVYSRGQGTDWYYVEMTPANACYSVVLPSVVFRLKGVAGERVVLGVRVAP